MKVSITKKYKSVRFEASRLENLAKYLSKVGESAPVTFRIELKGGENITTDGYAEFDKELEGIYDWKRIETIRISQNDYAKDYSFYFTF